LPFCLSLFVSLSLLPFFSFSPYFYLCFSLCSCRQIPNARLYDKWVPAVPLRRCLLDLS
jgi:hypothetical protein